MSPEQFPSDIPISSYRFSSLPLFHFSFLKKRTRFFLLPFSCLSPLSLLPPFDPYSYPFLYHLLLLLSISSFFPYHCHLFHSLSFHLLHPFACSRSITFHPFLLPLPLTVGTSVPFLTPSPHIPLYTSLQSLD